MQCFKCHQEIEEDESVSVDRHKTGEAILLGVFHPSCYEEIVLYLEQQYKEWQDRTIERAYWDSLTDEQKHEVRFNKWGI